MSTVDITNMSGLTGTQSHDHLEGSGEAIVTSFNYGRLTEFHLKRRGVDKKGHQRPEQSLKNEASVIEDWLAHRGLSPSDPVGEELGIGFEKCLPDYLSDLKNRELAEQTVSDRKTIVKKLRESFLELQRTSGLPEDFSGALKSLVEMVGSSVKQLARTTGIPEATLQSWIYGTGIPSPNSLRKVRRLEQVLKVSPGTLSSRLPDVYWSMGPARRCTTDWRSQLSILLRLKYHLPILPSPVQEEWDELERCYTDPEWASEHGFQVNSEWRVRWNTNRCPTAELNLNHVRGFFGYLCLPVTASDKRVAGLGFSPQDLTLALFTDSDLVLKFLHFKKGRSVSSSFNSATIGFLSLSKMLIRNETGYLRQRPEFGAKLPQPVAERDWPRWCEYNRLKLAEFQSEITNGRKGKKGKKDRVRMTRDPFEPIIDIIRERQHPITALFDLASRLESLCPLLERGSREVLAVHYRSIFHVRLISSNPLRGENFSMMTFIPQNHASYERACEHYLRYRDKKQTPNFSELFLETTRDSNLYQKRDGSWRLRFNERDFKNERGEDLERGILPIPYDVEIVPSVWPALAEYLFRHRPVLSEALRNTLQQARNRRSLPALTTEEEFAVVRCPYVFRPGTTGVWKVKNQQLMKGYGTGQISVGNLSLQILTLTSKYLPESKGFCAHACRHLVATEYIKNRPDGWEVAAAALHNTVEMVRRHYSWVEVGDLIKPWSDYHEYLKEKYDQGEL